MKYPLTALQLLLLFALHAQQTPIRSSIEKQAAPARTHYSIGNEVSSSTTPHKKQHSSVATGLDIIGNTFYDLQTNSSIDDRIHYDPSTGEIMAAWTMSLSPGPAYSDRGTGYNYYDGSQWNSTPAARLENLRTGWPSIVVTDTSEVVISHDFGAYNLRTVMRAGRGSGTWSQDILSNITDGAVWPRAVAGGPDNNTIHAIAITTPISNGGTLQKGINGALIYYRSLDGGFTWDIQDSILPHQDTALHYSFGPDSYAIDAKGNTVAIAVFNNFEDSFILKSTDNGNTWTRTTFLNSPLDDYNPDAAGNISDINNDGIADTIQSTDQGGSVLIDNNGTVHLCYGLMTYLDDDPILDAGWFYFPATSGLMYWNENSTTPTMITSVLDLDNDGQLAWSSINQIPLYYVSLTGQPSLGIDANNNIFCVYTMLNELEFNSIQYYHNLYLISSRNGGSSWNTPKDLTPNRPFGECVYGSLARTVDDNLRIVYQEDNEPGLAVLGDEDPDGMNNIIYLEIDTAVTQFFDIEEADFNSSQLTSIYPNPATTRAFLSFSIEAPGYYQIEISNITGTKVKTINLGNIQRGSFSESIDVKDLQSGVYVITLISENYATSKRLVIRK